VDEDVRAAVGLGDEAKALLSVEPLDGSLSHDAYSFSRTEHAKRLLGMGLDVLSVAPFGELSESRGR
jgi:hypothetical protein